MTTRRPNDNIIPMPDRSQQMFEEALLTIAKPQYGPKAVKEAVRECWRKIHLPEADEVNDPDGTGAPAPGRRM